tara:strand:- start:404 stop:631 length:228 start_codon:yes stop_codon:yes gene_type:complete
MVTTNEEREALVKIFKQVPFNEDSFIWFVLNVYIHCQYPEYPVLELTGVAELEEVRRALKDLFQLIDDPHIKTEI